jgi:short-subunit dehydrogenase
MKKKYGASWGLVTGGSSGIGKAIAEKLAKQKINVVIVSLDDDLLKNTTKEMKERFPDVEFRAIGVDLSGASGDYLQVSRMQQGASNESKLSPNGIEHNYPEAADYGQ